MAQELKSEEMCDETLEAHYDAAFLLQDVSTEAGYIADLLWAEIQRRAKRGVSYWVDEDK